MDDHIHKWDILPNSKKLVCKCDTVSSLEDVLANAEASAAHKAKIELLVAQLFARDLKKAAHDKAYSYVIANGAPIISDTQQVLV